MILSETSSSSGKKINSQEKYRMGRRSHNRRNLRKKKNWILLDYLFKFINIPSSYSFEKKIRNIIHIVYLGIIFILPFVGMIVMLIKQFGYKEKQHVILFYNTLWFTLFNFIMLCLGWVVRFKRLVLLCQSIGLAVASLVITFSFENSFLLGAFLGTFVLLNARIHWLIIVLYSIIFSIAPTIILFILKMAIGEWVKLGLADQQISYVFQFLVQFGAFTLVTILILQLLIQHQNISISMTRLLLQIEQCDFKDVELKRLFRISPISSDTHLLLSKIYLHLVEYAKLIPDAVKGNHAENLENEESTISVSSGISIEGESLDEGEDETTNSFRNYKKLRVRTELATVVCIRLSFNITDYESQLCFEAIIDMIEHLCAEKRGQFEKFDTFAVYVTFKNPSFSLEFATKINYDLQSYNTDVLSDTMNFVYYSIGIGHHPISRGMTGSKSRKQYVFYGLGQATTYALAGYGLEKNMKILIDSSMKKFTFIDKLYVSMFENLMGFVYGAKCQNSHSMREKYIGVYTIHQKPNDEDEIKTGVTWRNSVTDVVEHKFMLTVEEDVIENAIRMLNTKGEAECLKVLEAFELIGAKVHTSVKNVRVREYLMIEMGKHSPLPLECKII